MHIFLIFVGTLISIAQASEHRQLLISGAGPAGLAAGIAALKSGVENVLIVEKRSREGWATRQRSVFVSDVTMKTLEDFGVSPISTPISHWHIVRGGQQRVLPNSGHWKDEIFARMFHRRFEAIVSIGDVERALLDRFLELGGTIRFDAMLTLKSPGDRNESARVLIGDAEISADLILVSEGTRSTTRDSLGIPFDPAPVGIAPAYFSTDFRHLANGRSGGCFFFIGEDGQLDGYGCRANGFGTFGLIHPERFDREVQRQKLDEMARQVGVDEKDLAAPAPYVGALKLAREIHRERVFLIGDSARATDPSSSSGMAAAIEDAVHVGRFFAQSIHGEAERKALAGALLHDTETCFEKALYFQNLFAWGNRKLARVWGVAPVGRVNDPRAEGHRWSIHDGFYRVGSWLPRGLQARATSLLVHMSRGPKACKVMLSAIDDETK